MKGVKFGDYHSYDEWGLILTEKEIKSPKPKTIEIEIEGSDGVLDYTEFFGGVKYENRSLSFTFRKANIAPDAFLALYSEVQNALHGKKMQIILDDDTAFYYYGRVTINEWKSNKRIGEIVIEVDAEPYKYKIDRTTQTAGLTGKNLLNFDNYEEKNIGAGAWTRLDTGFAFVRGSRVGNNWVSFKVPVIKGKDYTFSAVKTTIGDDPPMVIYTDKALGTMLARNSKRITFTAEKTGFYIFTLIANSATEAVEYADLMLQEGTVATTYEEFDSTPKSVTIDLDNLRMPSVPTIYAQDYVEIFNGEDTIVLNAGESITADEFELKEGINQFNVEGTGVVVFDWQEGGL